MPASAKLRIGDWCVDTAAGQMSRGREVVRLEARTLGLLLDLAEHPGEVVSIDDLLDRVWTGVIVTPDSVYQAVAALRRLLGDDPRAPSYIATVPRQGYRLVAPVSAWEAPVAAAPRRLRMTGLAAPAAFALLAVLLTVGLLRGGAEPAARAPAVGVLPFLDLTPKMDHELLSDDLTEGLIDRLSQNPDLRTPGFRATFQLKGRHLPMGEAARVLGVTYLIDGSVHAAPMGYRITARLLRADDGFVVWSQSFERPAAQMPQVEADIAGQVGRVLAARGA